MRCAKRSGILAGRKTSSFTFPKKRWRIFAKQFERGEQLEAEWHALVEKYEEKHPEEGKRWRDDDEWRIAGGLGRSPAEV